MCVYHRVPGLAGVSEVRLPEGEVVNYCSVKVAARMSSAVVSPATCNKYHCHVPPFTMDEA